MFIREPYVVSLSQKPANSAVFGITIFSENKLSNAVGDSGICLKLTVILVSKHNHGSFKYSREKEDVFRFYIRLSLPAYETQI